MSQVEFTVIRQKLQHFSLHPLNFLPFVDKGSRRRWSCQVDFR